MIKVSLHESIHDHRPRTWRRRLILGLGLIAVIFAGIVAWAYWRGSSALREAISETERLDPNWRLEQLEANRIQIPDAENSALAIAAAQKLIDKSLGNANNEDANYQLLEELRRYPTARLNEEQSKAVIELLKPYQPASAEFHKVAAMPRGRFPITYSADFIGTLLNSQSAREASNFFQLLVNERTTGNDLDGAVLALRGQIFSARSVGDEPLLISVLIRIACEARAINTLEWVLAQSQLGEPSLAELQKLLEEDTQVALLTLGFRGERAGGFECVEYIKKNPGFMRAIGAVTAPAGTGTNWFDALIAYFPGSLGIQQADVLHFMNQAVETSKRPVEEHIDAYAKLAMTVSKLSLLARLLCPAVDAITRANVRRQGNLRCAIAALAAERYRIKFGKWPDKLNDLVTAGFLSQVPIDPYDGKPMRWKLTNEGRLIYTIAKDQVDNDGNIDPSKNDQPGYDMGFRLFDPEKRGSNPRPPIPPKQRPTDFDAGDPPPP